MLEVERISKSFAGKRKSDATVIAVDDVSMTVPQGEMFTLLGPSGCGKTTILRCIAGLDVPETGEIRVRDRILFSTNAGINILPNNRQLGMVFQSYAIWPHLNVLGNAMFPLQVLPKGTRPSASEVRERATRALAAMQLGELADRASTDLSGGQQQRLALARALVLEPSLVLLDEPLANLDARLRVEMRFELKRIQREHGLTMLFVTHDQGEALSMSDRVAVMKDGRIEQFGEPREIYQKPASEFVADFVGSCNFIDVEVVEQNGERLRVRTSHGDLTVLGSSELKAGDSALLVVRPEHLRIHSASEAPVGESLWHGKIVRREFVGESVNYEIDVGDLGLHIRCHQTVSLEPGVEVGLQFPAESCYAVACDGTSIDRGHEVN